MLRGVVNPSARAAHAQQQQQPEAAWHTSQLLGYRSARLKAVLEHNEQWVVDVGAYDAAPALADAAHAAIAASLQPDHHQHKHRRHKPTLQQHFDKQHQGSTSSLLRPTAIPPTLMRKMLQQQIDSATNIWELQELLEGRREMLTLKHLACIVKRVS